MNRYLVSAAVDIGVERESQEDFFQYKELDDDNLLCVIADGTGSRESYPQPAVIATSDIIDHIERAFHSDKNTFMMNPLMFLNDAFLSANQLIGAFKVANEEIFSGYAASVSAILLSNGNMLYCAHAGNTRVYLFRNGDVMQLTVDHTKAAELLADGKIDYQTYHIHTDRLKMTSGIGLIADPKIQLFSGATLSNDLFVMTTDGIHYALQLEYIKQFVLNAANEDEAAQSLILAAKGDVKYPDNMSAAIIHAVSPT